MSEQQDYPYATYLDIKFPPLQLVNVPALVKTCTEKWYNQTLCKVNDSVVRLGVMQGDTTGTNMTTTTSSSLSWRGTSSSISKIARLICSHSRDLSFPKAPSIAPAAPDRAVILMVETAAIVPTGDA